MRGAAASHNVLMLLACCCSFFVFALAYCFLLVYFIVVGCRSKLAAVALVKLAVLTALLLLVPIFAKRGSEANEEDRIDNFGVSFSWDPGPDQTLLYDRVRSYVLLKE